MWHGFSHVEFLVWSDGDKMDLITFVQTVNKLKEVKRTGWTRYNLADVESVADHSFGVALLAISIPTPSGVDRDLLIKMAVLHDFAESGVGDIVVDRGEKTDEDGKKVKDELEKAFAEKIFAVHPELRDAFVEYQEQKTPTSHFCKELDKLEMVFQALHYEKQVANPSTLDEFWENAARYIHSDEVTKIFTDLQKQRTKKV